MPALALKKTLYDFNTRLKESEKYSGEFKDRVHRDRYEDFGAQYEKEEKIKRLEAAGISVAERIEDIPGLVKQRLGMAA